MTEEKSLSFLYVEDDDMSRTVMQYMTKLLDAEPTVIIWEDSSDFLDRLRALDAVPDIVFLDVQIGPIDGFEMLQQIRGEPAYTNVPVIAMTASVTSSEIEDLKQAGFDGLIAKPVRKKLFAELIKRILDGESIWYVP